MDKSLKLNIVGLSFLIAFNLLAAFLVFLDVSIISRVLVAAVAFINAVIALRKINKL